jgi:hypothetical protein
MNDAILIGFKAISSAKGEFTIAYVEFTPEEGLGKACKDVFLKGHPLKREMIGKPVKISFNIENGRVSSITAA